MSWFKPLIKKTISSVLIVVFIGLPTIRLAHALDDLPEPVIPEDQIVSCKELSKVCVYGPSTKYINGVPVTRECWQYDHQFKCTDPNAADFCDPLKNPKCEVQGQECLEKNDEGVCLRYNHKYSCDINIKKQHGGSLPEGIEELEPTHLITQQWVSPECDAAMAGQQCTVLSETCLEGAETREINGVDITRDCWKKNIQWQCLGELQNECTPLEANPDCTLKEKKCISELQDGSCQIWDNTYECTEPETTQEISQCVDRDFAATMTNLEMLREISRYYDIESQTFFRGDASKCSIKLGGALEGVFGGNCCKSTGDPAEFQDWAVQAGTKMAISYAVTSLGSHYTYSMLAVNGPQYIVTGMQAAAGFANTFMPGNASFTPSFMGFGLSTSTSVTAGSTVLGGSGNMVLTFNPMAFAIAIAIMALQKWLECSQDEIITVFRKDAGLCHKVGSYCSKELLGACAVQQQVYCCYISKLSKIINVEGRKQLGRDFGTPESPRCEGFMAQDLERLDFSTMDLSEFYEEIQSRMPDTSGMIDRAKQQTENMKDSYYDDQQP